MEGGEAQVRGAGEGVVLILESIPKLEKNSATWQIRLQYADVAGSAPALP